jgi:L-lactate dehydrogenase
VTAIGKQGLVQRCIDQQFGAAPAIVRGPGPGTHAGILNRGSQMIFERGKGKVGLIGTGMVGASFAYSLVQSGLASELVLVDLDEARAEGEAMDLNHAMPFVRPMRIEAGGYDRLANSDVVVVCAGKNQRPGETRLDLLAKNAGVFEAIIPKVVQATPEAIILIATNPVDILTEMSAKIASTLPHGRVLGSGTLLDTARFRFNLGEYYGVDPRSINAWTIAEHGDHLVAAWSLANVAGLPLSAFRGPNGKPLDPAAMQDVYEATRNAGYEIVKRKQSTYYAIGVALLRIVEAILRDQQSVMTVSVPLAGRLGVTDMSLSLPAVVGRKGVEAVLELPLDETELAAFQTAGQVLKDRLAELDGTR